MKEFKSFYKEVKGGEGDRCKYNIRLDTYGCGCQHDCSYCYAKSLLEFRGMWNADAPAIADIEKIKKKVRNIPKGNIVRLGGMTDCFQDLEKVWRVTRATIKALNEQGVGYLIVTKSDLVAEYAEVMDKDLAHIQVSTTWIPYERAVPVEKRITAIESLYSKGFDVALRLSPFVPEFVDFDRLNSVNCDKVQVEFLRVNHWIKKWMPIDFSEYTLREGGYNHLPLEKKIEYLNKITGFKEVSVCEDVDEHYKYWTRNVNPNANDCCNLRVKDERSV